MNLPFLRKLATLGGPALRQVVAAGPAGTQPAAALHYLLGELPDLLLAAVLDVASGQPLATYAAERQYQPGLIAAPVVAVVRQLQAGVAAQAGEQLQEVLLTLTSQLHLLHLSPSSRQVLYLAADARDTNLAIARQVAGQAATQLD